MRLYQDKEHPLRVYLEGSRQDLARLVTSFSEKFYREKKRDNDREDAVDNILFLQDDLIYFPLGLLSLVIGELSKLNINYTLDLLEKDDTPAKGDIIEKDILEGIELREYQVEGVNIALSKKRGLLQLGTGAGKTEMMIAICKYLFDNKEGNILICVPTADLLHQTYDRMVFRGIPEFHMSKYGDSYKLDTSKRIAVSTVQTAYKRLDDEEFRNWYSDLLCIMLDEAQHGACLTWYTLIDRLASEYIIGVSAEPFYGDADHLVRDLILRGTVGPVLYRVPLNYLIDKGYLSKPYVVSINSQYPGNMYKIIDWTTVNKRGIITNPSRNKSIKDTALILINMEKNPLILVQQINHGKTLAEMISSEGKRVAVLTGGMKVSVYLDGAEIDTFKDTDNSVKSDFQRGLYDALIGTSVLDEGVDIPALSSVILAGGSKSKLKLIQRLGRGLRKKDGDNTTFIIDFQDLFNVVLHSHYKKRKQLYTEHDIPVFHCTDISSLPSFFEDIIEQRKRELSVQNS